MYNSMDEIMEMHGNIANDPWSQSRRAKLKFEKDLKSIEDDENKTFVRNWHTKPNTNSNMERFLLLQKQECDMLRNLQQNEWHEKVRNNNESLENTMGRYLEKQKNEGLYCDRYSQYLRENDPTLRKLASQLREAHVNKIRLAQIDEKERNKNSVAAADMPYVRALEERLKEDEEQEKLEQYQEEERKYKLRNILKHQIKERSQCDEMNKILEEDKVRIEAIIKQNIEEMTTEKEREFSKKMELRKSYHDFMKEKELEMIRQKQLVKNEESRLHEYTQFIDNRKGDLIKLKKLREENLNEVQNRLGHLLNKKQRDIDEFEEARQDVAIAQSEMQAFRFDQIERENKEKAKLKYIAELDKCLESNQLADKEEKLKNLSIDKEITKLTKIKEMEERDREMKKKERNMVFRNECQADIDFKRLEKEKCLEDQRERDRLEIQDNEKYNKDVENERVAMIKEMAPHLYPGCIPRGMLKEGEIQYLDDPLKNFLLNKKSYPDRDLC